MSMPSCRLPAPSPVLRVVAPYAHTLWDASLAAGVPLEAIQTLWSRTHMGEADVPQQAYLALLHHTWKHAGPLFGWKLGAAVRPTTYGVNGILLLACPTLGEALRQTLAFEALVHDLGRSQVRQEGDRVIYAWRNDCASHPAAGALAESVFAGLHTCAQWLAGKPVPAIGMEFAHAIDSVLQDQLSALAHVPVRGGATENRLVFDARVLDWPIPQADTSLLPLLQQHAHALLRARRPGEDALIAQIRQRISARLGQGAVKLADVARDMAMSTRTLQRKLMQQGLDFRQVLDHTRHELACHYLANTRTTVAQIAQLLGYQDGPALHHAFCAWQGMTPGQYRQQRHAPA